MVWRISAAGGDWNDGANWSTGTLPTAADDVIINVAGTATIVVSSGSAHAATLACNNNLSIVGGTFQLEGAGSMAGVFNLSGGSLGGPGTLSLVGTGANSTWTGGTMSGGGTTRIAAGATLQVGGGLKVLADRTIRNEGTLVDSTSYPGDNRWRVELDGAAVLDNAGVMDIRTDGSWENASGTAGTLVINNSGVLTKSAGTGSFWLGATLNNSGTVQGDTGALRFVGGGSSSGGATAPAAAPSARQHPAP